MVEGDGWHVLVVPDAADVPEPNVCGLVESGHGAHEPELAFELLHRFWGQGYATEASWAVLGWARSSGFERLWATVWEWNTASRRVLVKVGFTETENGVVLFMFEGDFGLHHARLELLDAVGQVLRTGPLNRRP